MNFSSKHSTRRVVSLLLACRLIVFYFISLFACTLESDSSTMLNTQKPLVNPLDSICTPISRIEAAYADRDSNLSVTVKGAVTRILSDDTVGDRHQRFIIALSNSQTLLIAHNVDIASRVSGISVGSSVYVHGDYIWNDQGGLIHWTHKDPAGVHENGWIALGNKKFE
jgi:hypothetical protein